MSRFRFLPVVALILTGTVYSQEAAEEEEGPWSGSLSLGYLATSGNTDTTSYNTKFGVGYVNNSWEHRLDGSSIGADESGVTNAEGDRICIGCGEELGRSCEHCGSDNRRFALSSSVRSSH